MDIEFFFAEESSIKHKTKICGGEKVESIPAWTKELEELNDEIGKEIDMIEMLQTQRWEPNNDASTSSSILME